MDYHSKRTLNKFLCKRIKTLRCHRGWKQEDAARRMRVSVATFSKIETGYSDVNISRLEQLADIFEIDLVQLLSTNEALIPSPLTMLQKKLVEREIEAANLKRKIIELYELLQVSS